MKIKAISLWQPWASLIVTNWKHYETRGWQTTYRGPLAIHASKHVEDVAFWFAQPEFSKHLKASGIQSFMDLPFGAVIGIVELVAIERTENIRHRLDTTERAFGDYSTGRYAWKLVFKERFIHPIPLSGKPGLFDIELELM